MKAQASSTQGPAVLPECWGHRGASATYPENTLASFGAAMHDGAEGIESDVHVTLDDVVVMFHDPSLERTTGTKAIIRDSHWHGERGIHQARTIKTPRQAIPTFAQTVELLMQPENRHVKFNVDVKVQNDPNRLFRLIHQTIASQPDWETVLAPRIILGLWHPKFIEPAKTHLPYLKRSHIGISPAFARQWFWDSCDAFSMSFFSLVTTEGEIFRRDCDRAGKAIMVWTVNLKEEMMEAVRWGVLAILTDNTRVWLDLRGKLASDFQGTAAVVSGPKYFLWTNWKYYMAPQLVFSRLNQTYLIKNGGPFDYSPKPTPSPASRVAASA
ncbi:hypothetical protein FRB94_000167 [Tulasnella sp. JGI-2019a]|nr:hypothetical protein FRB94_000167 [Tulasnella sp. JGI-2019a]KAG9015850.1 hypothetical protein FRB93_012415 [Tulasnella sp. JGI-2019a]KAG9039517.1 hypothetical protein FRB95_009097 [Tulasnella sp. JGI-2019a]